jgi:hypothetical protein
MRLWSSPRSNALAGLDIDHLDGGLRCPRDLLVAMFCRLMCSRCLSVSTMAPIMATSSTMPAIWKKKM